MKKILLALIILLTSGCGVSEKTLNCEGDLTSIYENKPYLPTKENKKVLEPFVIHYHYEGNFIVRLLSIYKYELGFNFMKEFWSNNTQTIEHPDRGIYIKGSGKTVNENSILVSSSLYSGIHTSSESSSDGKQYFEIHKKFNLDRLTGSIQYEKKTKSNLDIDNYNIIFVGKCSEVKSKL
jgi:hypothetical protein